MAKTDYRSVDAYIAAQPETSRSVLEEVRRIVRDALPQAVEVISYQIPAYRLPAGVVIYFAGWKARWSLYPTPNDLIARLGERLAPYEVEKGTIRCALSEPVPAKLIEDIVAMRAAEVAEAAEAKAARKRR